MEQLTLGLHQWTIVACTAQSFSLTYSVPLQTFPTLKILQTELTQVYDWQWRQLLWIWWEIPRLDTKPLMNTTMTIPQCHHHIPAQLYHVNILHSCHNVIWHTAWMPHATGLWWHAACVRLYRWIAWSHDHLQITWSLTDHVTGSSSCIHSNYTILFKSI